MCLLTQFTICLDISALSLVQIVPTECSYTISSVCLGPAVRIECAYQMQLHYSYICLWLIVCIECAYWMQFYTISVCSPCHTVCAECGTLPARASSGPKVWSLFLSFCQSPWSRSSPDDRTTLLDKAALPATTGTQRSSTDIAYENISFVCTMFTEDTNKNIGPDCLMYANNQTKDEQGCLDSAYKEKENIQTTMSGQLVYR